MSKHTLAEPDFVVARGEADAYDKRHPEGEDCLLVVEVSWSSKRRDVRKVALYARAGAPVYWILDVTGRRLEVFERPLPTGQYARASVIAEGETVTLPNTKVHVRVGDMLPRW